MHFEMKIDEQARPSITSHTFPQLRCDGSSPEFRRMIRSLGTPVLILSGT